MWWLTSVCSSLGPDHIRPQPLPNPPARGVSRGDDCSRKSEPPRCGFTLESTSAATRADEMTYLMEGDEVAHLAADGGNTDLEPALATTVAMTDADHDGAAAAVDAADPVRRAEVADVAVEGLRLHRASVEIALDAHG